MVAIVVEAAHKMEGVWAVLLNLKLGCFELVVGSSKKKGHGEKETLVKRGRPWHCNHHHGSLLELYFCSSSITKDYSEVFIE